MQSGVPEEDAATQVARTLVFAPSLPHKPGGSLQKTGKHKTPRRRRRPWYQDLALETKRLSENQMDVEARGPHAHIQPLRSSRLPSGSLALQCERRFASSKAVVNSGKGNELVDQSIYWLDCADTRAPVDKAVRIRYFAIVSLAPHLGVTRSNVTNRVIATPTAQRKRF